MAFRSRTSRGNQRRYRRTRKPQRMRAMLRPKKAAYAQYHYCAVLMPGTRNSGRGTAHDGLIAALRQSGLTYRINTERTWYSQHTRVYLADEAGLVWLKIFDAEKVWKMFELVDEN